MAQEVAERDRVDSQRTVAPLKPAADALLVTTDGMTVDEVVQLLVDRVQGGS